jgi:putative drug exporter of the RND superfamily
LKLRAQIGVASPDGGVGLAVAIAVDATIVRCMLVPAVMVLMRNGNWWLPAWLERVLPRIDIESDDFDAAKPSRAKAKA